MAKGIRPVVVAGVAHSAPPGAGSPAGTVWAAIEDAGVVPSAARPVIVFAGADAEDLSAGLNGIPGVEVRAPRRQEPFAAATTRLRTADRDGGRESAGETDSGRGTDRSVVVVYEGPGTPAVALTLDAPGLDHYGVLARGAAKRTAQLQGLAPRPHTATPPPEAPFATPLLLSARSETALRAHADALAGHLDARPETSLTDAAFTLATARTVWEHRAAVHATDRPTAVAALRDLAAGRSHDAVSRGTGATGPSAVFVFPGQGGQWLGMARELADTSPLFRAKLAECGRALAPFLDFTLDDALCGGVPLERIDVAQPALFAVTVALAELWRAHGVAPAAVAGVSMGEIAAATVAGGLSLSDGARLAAAFSKAQALIQGQGEMVAVNLSVAETRDLIDACGLSLEVAVVNGPRATVVAGAPEEAAALVRRLEDTDVRARLLPIGIAAHSPQIEQIRAYLLRELAPIRPRPATVPMFASATAGRVDTADLDAAYWYRSLRRTADFQGATEAALNHGHRVFVEMSPHPVLAMAIEDTAARHGHDAAVLDTMRRDAAGYGRVVRSLTHAHLHGVTPDWNRVFDGAHRVPLPAYPLDVADTDDRDTATAETGDTGLREELRPLPEAQRLARVTTLITRELAAPDGEPAGADRDFRSLGLDSLGALTLRNRLNDATGLRLPATSVFDHPTPRVLAREVLRLLFGDTTDATDPRTAVTPAVPADPDEPIAIVGMACRFPGGVTSPEQLWELVRDGRDAVTEFPADRGWDLAALQHTDADRPGTFYQREAALLADVDRFDAGFFGISPREALAMDPQQRMLLETSWEALERAGIDATAVRGSRTGVFTGVMNLPYGRPLHQARPDLEGHVLTGTASSVVSGRLSYALGLEGPALTLDTACSSSLVALHLACQSLRQGECDLAFTGGATVMAEPGMFIEFSRQRALSPDGRSKPFSADADGFGMAEGVGVLVVERLSDARRLGHEVLAVVRGSAVNQDGASNGLTAPNGPSQQRVIREALAHAGVRPGEVDVVEAHGTGTRLGDPIEAQALIATYGGGRPAGQPLYLGSLKSNIGHAQAAAGVAGVIKMVEAMRHGVMPKSLYADRPTGEVDWSLGAVELLAEARPWEPEGRPRRAAVSSFGISGTNAHVVLEQPAEEELVPAAESAAGGPVALVVSGKSVAAVRAQAAVLGEFVAARSELALGDVAWSLVASRSVFDHRAVVVGAGRDEVLAGLGEVSGSTAAGAGRVGVLFSGQGAQRVGMGCELADAFPVFAEALGEVCSCVDPLLGRSLRAVMWEGPAETLERTEFAQPALFAFEVALARLWQSWGVSFATVAGHSVGEIAAAVVAGVLSLEDAAQLAVSRGALMQTLPEGGAMLAVAASEEEVVASLNGAADLAVAAVNGPQAVVVSGAGAEVSRVEAFWREQGRRTTRLRVSHAFHSPLMEPMLAEFRTVLEGLTFHEPTVTVSPSADSERPFASPAYWLDHARHAVRFADAVARMAEADVLVELGPDAALTPVVDDNRPVLASVRRKQPESKTALAALGQAWAHGAAVDWRAVLPEGRRVELPTYAFQRESYWQSSVAVGGSGVDGLAHPLLSGMVELPGSGGVALSGRLAPRTERWLADHVVAGATLFPGTGFVELAAEAVRHCGARRLGELVVRTPLVVPAEGIDVQVWVAPDDGTDAPRELFVRARGADGAWVTHVSGTLEAQDTGTGWAGWDRLPAGAEPIALEGVYEELAARGYAYGSAFRGLRAVWRAGDEVFAEVALPEGPHADGYGLHPALLDAALHALLVTGGTGGVRVPFSFTGVTWYDSGPQTALRVRLKGDGDTVRLDAASPAGGPVLSVDALTLRAADRPADDALFVVRSHPVVPSAETTDWTAVDTLAGLGDGPVPPVVVLRTGSPAGTAGTGAGDPAADTRTAVRSLLETVWQWLSGPHTSRLVVCASQDDPVGAALGGFLRAAYAEHPDRFGLLDTDGTAASEAVLPRALGLFRDESHLIVRNGAVTVPRLARAEGALAAPDGPWRLDLADTRSRELALVPDTSAGRPLGAHEVRIGVRAAGLNFRDVLIRLGAYPGEAALGSEAAGVVLETGDVVTDLRVGDRVAGMLTGGFAPVAVADRRRITRIPAGWTFAEAASVPITFLTAYYGLVELAGLRAGETVLIHSAAGGVGMAAVQIARHLGAEVYATASPAKWDALRAAGLDDDHLASSRDLDFADRFGPVDVVLNSLAREFVDASLGLVRPGGRFVEMGKADLRRPEDVRDAHPDVAYLPFDLYEVEPDLIAGMNTRLTELFEAGALRLPPLTCWDVRRAPEAFQYVEQARHVGKVVLTVPAPLDPEGTALITGGTGGLGAETAAYLVTAHGVRHLLLLSRRGPDAPEAAAVRSRLEALGADVRITACDVTEREELSAALDRIPAEHPLTAVVHAAGVVDDALLDTLTPGQLDAVLAPKADAAVHLDALTRDLDLARFVLFSSVSSVLGVPGQAGYGAANGFLDALARDRHRAGRPATSLAWGLWAQPTGITAGLGQQAVDRWARRGIAPLSTEHGLALFDRAAGQGLPGVAPFALDAAALRRQDSVPSAMRGFARPAPVPRDHGGRPAPTGAATPTPGTTDLLRLVIDHAAAVQGHRDPAAIDRDRAFRDAGFDSMTSLELRQRLAAATGLTLPSTLVFDHPTPAALAGRLEELLGGTSTGSTAPATGPAPTAGDRDGDPLVIVGMGCRFPGGVGSPEQLWDLVRDGRDAVSAFPADRGWDLDALTEPGGASASDAAEGGFLDAAGAFDAEFFGISPREALAMDPQQRLLLETTWEAMERAGIDPATVRGSRTGVFTGAVAQEYGPRLHQSAPGADGHLLTGTTSSVLSGRLAYFLGLEGPAVTVDTACSSSLVALHLACQSLRQGETDLALVGGATVMASPGMFVEFSRQGGLARDGRCKSFSDDADGTGWSEGVGVLVVERLSDARRLGHEVLAVVRGSAVNQDGASNGLTAPNGPSQQRVILEALTSGGLEPGDVDVVEAHGTGTRLGDPIEAQALIATYGDGRPAGQPLYLGSLKSNIGHAQAAAGVAGVIKMVEAMRHGMMPKSLYADRPTGEVDWSSGAVELLAEARPWEPEGRPRRAAVSSFGISGTNAHVVLEQPAEEELVPAAESAAGGPVALVVSGKSVAAVRAQAAVLGEFVAARPELALGDVAWSLVASRSVFDHRAVVVGAGRDEVLAGLGEVSGSTAAGAGRVGVLFSGQGAQRVGMGCELADAFPVFAEALDEVCGHVDPLLGRSLRAVMWEGPAETLERTEFAQPALFAFEVALARLWQSWGVSFATVAGHSVGEIAAAVVAGVLSLEDAAQLAVSRGALMQTLPEGGAMLAVAASEEEVVASLNGAADLAVAAVNGPQAVVVSGAGAEVERLEAFWREQGRRTTRLRVSHAFHSPLMEPMLAEFRTVLEGLTFHEPTMSVSPSADSEHPFASPAYWLDHARHAVRFADAVARMTEADVLVELGPDAALTPVVDDNRPVLASVRRKQPESKTALAALGQAWAHGAAVDWRTVLPEGRRVDLPTYAFQHQTYWLAPPAAERTPAGGDPQPHPMLTVRTELPGSGGVVLSGRLTPGSDAWLPDHSVMGTVLLPGTGFVELAMEAARSVGADEVGELVLRAPMVFPGGKPRDVQVWVAPGDGPERELHIRSRAGSGEWTLHATGSVATTGTATAAGTGFTPDWTGTVWPPAGAVAVPVDRLYPDLAVRGYEYGPAFRGVTGVWERGADLFAEIVLPEGQPTGFGLHPALLDAALHALPLTGRSYEADEVRLPFSFNGVSLLSADARRLRVLLRVEGDAVTVLATDSTGAPVIAVDTLILRPVDRAQLEAAGAEGKAARFIETWEHLADAGDGPARVPGTWLLLGDARPDLAPVFTATVTAATWDGTTVPDGVLVSAGRVETLLNALHTLHGTDAPVWCVTTGAVATGTDDPEPDVEAGGVWGMGRVAALELPQRWAGLVDLPARADDATRRALVTVLTGDGAEDQLAVRRGGRWARRIVPAPAAPATPWTPKGTVLITGGTGALGGHLARRLAAQPDIRLVLLSRRGTDAPGADGLLADLTAAGAHATAVAADITDRVAMAELVSSLDAAGAPVRTVVHTAGVVRDVPLADTTAEALRDEMAAKVRGALVLDELLPDLEDFVLYSSVSGTWGAAGQAGYAAGNACLDALARRRRAQGRPATAVAWGPWSGGGMVEPEIERELRRRGLTPLSVPGALQALEQTVATGSDAVVAEVDWARFLPAFTASRPSPLLSRFAPAPRQEAAPKGGVSLTQRLSALPAAEREAVLLDVVCGHVAAVVGQSDPGRIDADRALKDFGFDSLMSVELRNRLAGAGGVRLPATLVFDHPTPHALARYLLTQLVLDDETPGASGDGPVLADLERVEVKALSALTDAATRAELATRIGSLLDRLAELDARPVTATTGLENASADELMRFIDSELGNP